MKSKTKRGAARILWGVDPFGESPAPIRKMAQALGQLTGQAPAAIQPVHVLSEDAMTQPYPVSGRWPGPLDRETGRILASQLERLKLKGLLPAKVLVQKGASLREAVAALIREAKRERCEFIAVSTHGRSGLKRLILGSFTETLLLSRPVHLLTVNPSETLQGGRTVLFATDFSAESRRAFRKMLDYASRWKLKVVIFHKIPFPAVPGIMAASPYGLPVDPGLVSESFAAAKREAGRDAKAMTVQARKAGVSAGVVLDAGLEPVRDAILIAARRKRAAWIAMTAHARHLPVALGSVARYVVRHARTPVLVLSP